MMRDDEEKMKTGKERDKNSKRQEILITLIDSLLKKLLKLSNAKTKFFFTHESQRIESSKLWKMISSSKSMLWRIRSTSF